MKYAGSGWMTRSFSAQMTVIFFDNEVGATPGKALPGLSPCQAAET